MTRGEIICGIVLGLSIAIIIGCLMGCTPIMLQPVDLTKLPVDNIMVMDVRPCEGAWLCWPWLAPHKIDVYRNEAGALQVMPEESNGQGLDTFASPVESAINHFSWGP